MKITIVGTGYVGLTTGVCLASKNHEITCLDIDKEKILKLQNNEEIIYEPNLKELLEEARKNNRLSFTIDYKKTYNFSKVIMLCVATPESEDGKVDMKYINIAIEQIISNIKNDCFIIIKSTVPVGTCDKILERTKNCKYKINLIFNPEFLSQGEAIENFLNPQRIVIGTNNKESRNLMEEIYADFNCPKLFMDLKSAEISKYDCNNFLAIKLAYINEIANLCEKLGINIENILKVMKSDKRIGEFYLNPGIGYGGSCLPKDTKALATLAKENNVKNIVFSSSSSVYGNRKTVPFKETDNTDYQISPYAATKKADELFLYVYHHLYKFNVMILRFFTVYGPRQRGDLAISKFVKSILEDKPIQMYGDGNTERDYTYIDDIIEGIQKSIEYLEKNKETYEILNIGESTPIKLIDMIKTIEEKTNKKALTEKLPMQAGDVNITYANIEKAKKLIGYKPKISFEVGIENFVKWFKENQHLYL